MAAGLYIHVPFCRRKCPYCNFYSIAAEPELLERYTQAGLPESAALCLCRTCGYRLFWRRHTVSAVSGTDCTDPGNGGGLFHPVPGYRGDNGGKPCRCRTGTAAPVSGKRRKPAVFRGAVAFGQPAETAGSAAHGAGGGRDRLRCRQRQDLTICPAI